MSPFNQSAAMDSKKRKFSDGDLAASPKRPFHPGDAVRAEQIRIQVIIVEQKMKDS